MTCTFAHAMHYVCKWAAMADYVLLKDITLLAKKIDTFLSGLLANLVTVASIITFMGKLD